MTKFTTRFIKFLRDSAGQILPGAIFDGPYFDDQGEDVVSESTIKRWHCRGLLNQRGDFSILTRAGYAALGEGEPDRDWI